MAPVNVEEFMTKIGVQHDIIVEATGGRREIFNKVQRAWRNPERPHNGCGLDNDVFDTIYKAIQKMKILNDNVIGTINLNTGSSAEAREWHKATATKAVEEFYARLS
jgi:hypothetical protein